MIMAHIFRRYHRPTAGFEKLVETTTPYFTEVLNPPQFLWVMRSAIANHHSPVAGSQRPAASLPLPATAHPA